MVLMVGEVSSAFGECVGDYANLGHSGKWQDCTLFQETIRNYSLRIPGPDDERSG